LWRKMRERKIAGEHKVAFTNRQGSSLGKTWRTIFQQAIKNTFTYF